MAKKKRPVTTTDSRPKRPLRVKTVSAPTQADITRFPAPKRGAASAQRSVADLRRAVKDATWTVADHLKDTDRPPVYPLGGSHEGLRRADATQRIDFNKEFATPPKNPDLLRLAVERKLIGPEALQLLPQNDEPPGPPKRPPRYRSSPKGKPKSRSGRKTER
jgi:hypothetical protein